MLNPNDKSLNQRIKLTVFSAALSYTMILLPATTAYANDFDIYQKPRDGQKTMVMMLDTSGSMGGYDEPTTTTYDRRGNPVVTSNCASGDLSEAATASVPYVRYYCAINGDGTGAKYYSRLTRLKDGMFNVLNSSDSGLTDIFMGLGNFSANGDGKTGQILVPAAKLDAASTANTVGSQRYKLKMAISLLVAQGYTPSAQAFPEAAAYLMGTNTSALGTTAYTVKKDLYYTATPGSSMSDKTVYYGTCTTWNNVSFSSSSTQTCNTTPGNQTTTPFANTDWTYSATDPGIAATGVSAGGATVTRNKNSNYSYQVYTISVPTVYDATTSNSGFENSVMNDAINPGIVNTAKTKYASPLPTDKTKACGQGIYFLSDGQPNKASNTSTVMNNSLTSATFTPSTAFACPTTGTFLPETPTGGNGSSGWSCMGAFAQQLYAKSSNPANVSIKTAFVAFGTDFGTAVTASSSQDAINACKIGSKIKDNTCSPTFTDPTFVPNATLKNPLGGYGNGGFYIATSPANVTASVLGFISDLGDGLVTPLVTGAATVPVDDLNPNGFQPFGYLRMIEPNPAKPDVLLWRGNVKKYNLSGGALKDSSTNFVLNASGALVSGTTDLWNASTGDGGDITKGGAYSRVPMPITGRDSTTYLRPLYTDIASVTGTTPKVVNGTANGGTLTPVPGVLTTPTTPTADIPKVFGVPSTGGLAPLKDLLLVQQKALINFLGYDLPLDSTAIPATLPLPVTPFLAMGGSVHAQPIQITYSASVDTTTGVVDETTRKDAVLYGSMEGALHLVDASTGVEKMAFVPKEILTNTTKSSTLRVGSLDASVDTSPTAAYGSHASTPNQGVDGPWVADPAYKTVKTGSGATLAATLTASRLNVYGGLRMGGSSYYGLNVLSLFAATPTAPTLIFRVGPDVTGFERMGQSWSKPVIANIRKGNVIKRVMIVGGGYDPQYESDSYIPTTGSPALGNTVYMIDTTDGSLVWSATNTNMIHSVVSRISTVDRDGDSLVDSLYFGDLGGQVFRADFNNAPNTPSAQFPVRVVRLANLGTDSSGSQLTTGKNPRFYEAPTITIHDQGSSAFALVGLASGNRSQPLDVLPVADGGQAETGLPVNNVYGIIDRDLGRTDLIRLNSSNTYVNTNGSTYSSSTVNKTLANLQQNPQTTISASSVVADTFFATTGTVKDGWYRSLSSTAAGVEKANGTLRKAGGLKAFEEPVAIKGKLYVTVYDPEGTGVTATDSCNPRVVGETDYQSFCLPYGACLNSTTGMRDTVTVESATGFQTSGTGTTSANLINNNVLGAGIRSIVLGDKGDTAAGASCKNVALIGNQSSVGGWSCARKLVQTLWYEKKPNPTLVK